MMVTGLGSYKACKVCNTPVEACKKYVKSMQKAGFLQGFYRVFTYFYRYITGFTYFLVTDQKNFFLEVK